MSSFLSGKYRPRPVSGWGSGWFRVRLGLALLALSLVGCAGGVRQELPVPIELVVSASERVNPTEAGRPSPIHIRVFELSNATAFEAADFFELQANPVSIPGEVIDSMEFVLVPGEVRVLRKRAALETRFLGVVAGYRDLHGSVWRTVIALPAPHFAGRVWGRALSPEQRYFVVVEERRVFVQKAPGGR